MGMDLYILDSLYRRIAVVDNYESLIWTERFTAIGDFQLDIASTLPNKRLFQPGVNLAIERSHRVMTVETYEDILDEEGRKILKVYGRSIEKILDERLLMYVDEIDGHWIPWYVFNPPADAMHNMFDDICVTGILNSEDVIAGVTYDSGLFPDDTIVASPDIIEYAVDPKTLYAATKEIADAFSIGFRLVRDPLTGALSYDIYTGRDLTTAQSTLPAVVFSENLDNLKNTKEITTAAEQRNVAYVVYGNLHEIVYATDVDPAVEGFQRRAIFVNISSIDSADPTYIENQMIQAGKDALFTHRQFTALDGEVVPNTYEYGVDYQLGDLVEQQDSEGSNSQMRVVEQIFISDREGDRDYPTLQIERFVTEGSWLDMPPGMEWDDFTTETWDDMAPS